MFAIPAPDTAEGNLRLEASENVDIWQANKQPRSLLLQDLEVSLCVFGPFNKAFLNQIFQNQRQNCVKRKSAEFLLAVLLAGRIPPPARVSFQVLQESSEKNSSPPTLV